MVSTSAYLSLFWHAKKFHCLPAFIFHLTVLIVLLVVYFLCFVWTFSAHLNCTTLTHTRRNELPPNNAHKAFSSFTVAILNCTRLWYEWLYEFVTRAGCWLCIWNFFFIIFTGFSSDLKAIEILYNLKSLCVYNQNFILFHSIQCWMTWALRLLSLCILVDETGKLRLVYILKLRQLIVHWLGPRLSLFVGLRVSFKKLRQWSSQIICKFVRTYSFYFPYIRPIFFASEN